MILISDWSIIEFFISCFYFLNCMRMKEVSAGENWAASSESHIRYWGRFGAFDIHFIWKVLFDSCSVLIVLCLLFLTGVKAFKCLRIC